MEDDGFGSLKIIVVFLVISLTTTSAIKLLSFSHDYPTTIKSLILLDDTTKDALFFFSFFPLFLRINPVFSQLANS